MKKHYQLLNNANGSSFIVITLSSEPLNRIERKLYLLFIK
jgi:hypothetical protein